MISRKWVNYFSKITTETAKLSTCCKIQVGCLLIKENRILSIGYNGVPKNENHCYDYFGIEARDENMALAQYMLTADFKNSHHEFQLANEIHAEQNCLAYAAKNGICTNNSILFVNLSPCQSCSKFLIAAGIKEVYYMTEYEYNIEGRKFLEKNGIKIYKIGDILK